MGCTSVGLAVADDSQDNVEGGGNSVRDWALSSASLVTTRMGSCCLGKRTEEKKRKKKNQKKRGPKADDG